MNSSNLGSSDLTAESRSTDRELLELAARAAGIEGAYFHSDNPIHCGIYQARGEYYWNPLISDSEALRLAVKLRLEISPCDDPFDVSASIWIGGDLIDATESCTDEMAATRRAIVRAAAEMGKRA